MMYVLAHYALEMDGGATLGNNAECGERRGEGCLGCEDISMESFYSLKYSYWSTPFLTPLPRHGGWQM